MKYIRTKDGRIITFTPKEKYENDKATFDWFVANYCGGGINVLKIADTIKELCDEFIWKNLKEFRYSKARQYERYSGWGDLKRFMSYERDYGRYLHIQYEIYGAIWTDKGLIYVAKMNEKGELELL